MRGVYCRSSARNYDDSIYMYFLGYNKIGWNYLFMYKIRAKGRYTYIVRLINLLTNLIIKISFIIILE